MTLLTLLRASATRLTRGDPGVFAMPLPQPPLSSILCPLSSFLLPLAYCLLPYGTTFTDPSIPGWFVHA
jgi:hypothetical protein